MINKEKLKSLAADIGVELDEEALQSFSEMQDQGAVGGSTWDMSRWPANLRLIDERSGAMSWTRGGFVWPGHSQLKVFGERSSNKGT